MQASRHSSSSSSSSLTHARAHGVQVKGKAAIDVLAARIGKSGGALVQQTHAREREAEKERERGREWTRQTETQRDKTLRQLTWTLRPLSWCTLHADCVAFAVWADQLLCAELEPQSVVLLHRLGPE
eukprot:1448099-Rhodomonas_salina.1